MKALMFLIGLGILVSAARAEVRIQVEDVEGVAWLKYECTAGEVVRAFALNVSVDRGRIVGISDFHRGESTPGATGYGIFPASFRDHLSVTGGTNVDWDASAYTPLAAVNPGDALPGLNSSGVTLEFGGLWDPNDPAAVPGPAGTLCALHLSEPARVSVEANASRGGVVSAEPGIVSVPVFVGALVGPAITGTACSNGELKITFKGGELQTAPSVNGPWTDTGNGSGQYTALVAGGGAKFFRVHQP